MIFFLVFVVFNHVVKNLGGQTAGSVITAVESVGSLTGMDGYSDLRQLCCTVVVGNTIAIFIDSVIFIVLPIHKNCPFCLVVSSSQIGNLTDGKRIEGND